MTIYSYPSHQTTPEGLRLSKFSEVHRVVDMEVRLDCQVISKKGSFKYLGAIIQGNGEIDKDGIHRTGTGRLKWRLAFGVLCDKKLPIRLKT
ncbi:hypothetical protein H5410_034753 [Solanum commersonii]|uniref:Uncharacterized protein n=1 Tax=Solanum commersonii TaxID=4109 RepID=A0A9J5YUA1_SOLCO|nr:hypothetical protein H5410_034753 [Solanum commersonii]